MLTLGLWVTVSLSCATGQTATPRGFVVLLQSSGTVDLDLQAWPLMVHSQDAPLISACMEMFGRTETVLHTKVMNVLTVPSFVLIAVM